MRASVVALLWLAAVCAAAQTQETPLRSDPRLGIAIISLKDGRELAPDATLPADEPGLAEFLPPAGHVNGTSVIVCPGGSYTGLSMILEGRQIADWFAARGIAAFLLNYRLGPNNLYPVPLQDAQRAIRILRYRAKSLGLAPNKIGIIGFSAGGHLAAAAATLFHLEDRAVSDPIDRLSDRPDYAVLAYPWLNAMQTASRGITYCSTIKIIPEATCRAYEAAYTPALHVTSSTPPTFLYTTADDQVVPASASVEYFSALLRAGVPAELHVFRHGEHGTGLGNGSASLDEWPVLLEHWLRDQNFL